MAWTQCGSDIPMNDWSLTRAIHPVAVADQVYLFGYNNSGDEDAVQVLAFNPASSSWRALQPLEQGDGSNEDASGPRGEETVIAFAVASKEMVYVCVGGRENLNAHVMKVFDTRNDTWSSVRTSGDVPSKLGQSVHACEHNGHVYVCEALLFQGSSLYELDLSSLRWTIICTWDEDSFLFQTACLLPYKNRLYMLLDEMTGMRQFTSDDNEFLMKSFDLETRAWKELNTFNTSPVFRHYWLPFIIHEKLYAVLREKPRCLMDVLSDENVNEIGLIYSFASNSWVGVTFRGIAPVEDLHAVCVVGTRAVFFSFTTQKAFVLDFLPSLSRLCYQAIAKNQLDASSLPTPLQVELLSYIFPWLKFE